MQANVTVVDHPLIQHKLTLMRRRQASTSDFRKLMREVAHMHAYEVTRDLPLTTQRIETPIAPMEAPDLAAKQLCFIPILRAGHGLLYGMQHLLPPAHDGHGGLNP